MSKLDIDITGIDKLEKDLDRMTKNIETNASNAEGQLYIDLNLISENLDFVNNSFNTNFSDTIDEKEIFDFFVNKYQEFMVQGFMKRKYNPKKKFNNLYSPYAKVE